MKILQVKKTPVFDIFTGIGWKNHSRYRFVESGYTHLSGLRLPRHIIEQCKTRISDGLPAIYSPRRENA